MRSVNFVQKQKIFLISNTSWYLYNFRRTTILSLKELGHAVYCIAPLDAYSKRLESDIGASFIDLQIEGKSIGPIKEIKSFLRIGKILRLHSPDIVFNFTIKINIYSGITCSILGIPYVNNVSGLGTAILRYQLIYPIIKKLYQLANSNARVVFFQNDEDVLELYPSEVLNTKKIRVLPGSGVSIRHFDHREMRSSSPISFILIARIIYDKGVKEFAEACSLLKEQGISYNAILVGELGVSNKSAIPEYILDDWVDKELFDYAGMVDDVRPYLERSHVVVLPSYREGMPRTILEAGAIGRPSIVSDVPGCRQAVKNGETGWICEPRSTQSLFEQMKMCAQMDVSILRLHGEKARKFVEQRFNEDEVVKAYQDCL